MVIDSKVTNPSTNSLFNSNGIQETTINNKSCNFLLQLKFY